MEFYTSLIKQFRRIVSFKTEISKLSFPCNRLILAADSMLSINYSKGTAVSEAGHLGMSEIGDISLCAVGVPSVKRSLNRKISAFDSLNSDWRHYSVISSYKKRANN